MKNAYIKNESAKRKEMKRCISAKVHILSILMMTLFMVGFMNNVVISHAEDSLYIPKRVIYENKEEFSLASKDIVESVSYGENIGAFSIKGNIAKEMKNRDVVSYTTKGKITFGYMCNPEKYEGADVGTWMHIPMDDKKVGDIDLTKKIDDGAIVVQKSSDGQHWVNACEPIRNIFSDKKVDLSNLYTTSDNEVKTGTYYRVLVFYAMAREVNPHKGMFGKTDYDLDLRFCAEEYKFFVAYAENPIVIYNITDRSKVTNGGSVENGFSIDFNDANVTVTIKNNNGAPQNVKSLDSFVQPGDYVISATSPVGDTFDTLVKVTGGLSTHNINGKKFENAEKDGYLQQNEVASSRITSLTIGQKSGNAIKAGVVGNYQAYGITGSEASIYMDLKSNSAIKGTGWEVVSDEWGKKDKQTIADTKTGTVGSGVLIVQKQSSDKKWKEVMHASDYGRDYAGKGEALVYSPSGSDVQNGVYLRVLYAYEIKKSDGKEKRRCLEQYDFYICSDELGAVTFHNLTAEGKIEELFGEDKNVDLQKYKTSESMDSGAVTVTGFTIDTKLNPTVKYEVKRNGVQISSEKNKKYTESGRYDISLCSAVGSTKEVTLYVDAMSDKECMEYYFGDGFINGKRIYDENAKYPVFEGGETRYSLSRVDEGFQPLYGKITNLTTKKTIEITPTRVAKRGTLTEPGEYVVTLNNNPTNNTKEPSGDNRTITFHFYLIEKGTAPGPHCNYENLIEWEKMSISGIHHTYYGLSYRIDGNKRITYVYATKEDAVLAAYEREGGTVEKQKDGSYLYASSEDPNHKKRYDDLWDLTEDYQNNADSMIEELYIDPSAEDTYVTLDPKVKIDDPEKLDLAKSIMYFPKGKGQREKLEITDALPILNGKPYAFQPDGKTAKTRSGYDPFIFIKDKYGADSNEIVICDASGKNIKIDYNRSVSDQLAQKGCTTGKVSITEKTVYGDSRTYDAVYFADNDNTAKVTISYYDKEEEKTVVLSQDDAGTVIPADAFSLKEIKDDLDPYNMVLVWNKKEQGVIHNAYEAGQDLGEVWSEDGEYEVTIVNRVGYKYSFTVSIENSIYATIAFNGQGTEGFQNMLVKRGDKNVELPVPKREGYEFVGYSDEDDTIYESVITQITFNGHKTLSPIWKAKETRVIFRDEKGKELDSISVINGAVVDLPVQKAPEGYKFDGWMLDGNLITESAITITGDEDIVLVAKFSESTSGIKENNNDAYAEGSVESENKVAIEDEIGRNSTFPWAMIPILGVIAGAVVVFKRKQKSDKS